MDPKLLDLLRRLHEDVHALSDDELAELAAGIKASAATVDKSNPTPEDLDLLAEAKENLDIVKAETAERETAAAERIEQANALLAEIEDAPAVTDAEVVDAEVVDAEVVAEAETVVAEAVADEAAPVAAASGPAIPPTAPAPAAAAPRRPSISHLAARRPPIAAPTPTATADRAGQAVLIASSDVPGLASGAEVDVEQWAHAVTRKFEASRKSTIPGQEKVYLGSIRVEYPDNRFLDMNEVTNLAKIEAVAGRVALNASGGVCGPVAVDYSVTGVSVADRPVKAGMLQMGADRGGLRYIQPHTLAMVTADGPAALWLETTDASPGGSTKAHATFVCQAPLEAYVDSVTSIAQFGNFQARYFPEQITQYMETVDAVHARLAESTLLGAMLSGSTSVTADSYELGAARDLMAVLDRATVAMRSRHRMDPQAPLRFWMPFWLRSMLRADQARQLPGDSYSGAERLGIADAYINEWFAVRNINTSEYLDSPTGGNPSQLFGPQLPGQLLPWPLKTLTVLSPEGQWTFLDGGELNLGMVRDSTLNKTNDFQMFSETFEKAIFRGVESQFITWTIDPTGASAATVATNTAAFETPGS